MTALHGPAAWCGPALLVGIAWQAFSGEAVAPLTVLGAAVAPLLALLAPRAVGGGLDRSLALAALATLALLLWANCLAVADLARAHGSAPRLAVAAAALALLAVSHPRVARLGRLLVPAGLVALGVTLAGLALAAGAPPWAAWARVASRGAFEFAATSPAVTRGATMPDAVTLTFTEPHRITVASAGVFRVVERDGDRETVRDWRLTAGETLALRPGDRLVLPAGVTVRFEPGRRVPGVAMSGVGWADPRGRPALGAPARLLGPIVTLAGGALAVVGGVAAASAAEAVIVPIALAATAVAAAVWGIYAALAAPELAVLGSPAALVAQVPVFAVGGAAARALPALATCGLLALFFGAALALRARMEALAAPWPGALRRPQAAWAAVVLAAALATLAPADAWPAALLALGLGASTLAVPLAFAATPLERRLGALAGGACFVALAAAAAGLGALGGVGAYPAVLALPVSAVAVAVARLRRA
ncbi:MAG: hypothetical protein HYR86_06260 [Candidatus Rokubacteria bacterium]|nr:hypothetical protein [Candidatus Rokubacteria bacterium]